MYANVYTLPFICMEDFLYNVSKRDYHFNVQESYVFLAVS